MERVGRRNGCNGIYNYSKFCNDRDRDRDPNDNDGIIDQVLAFSSYHNNKGKAPTTTATTTTTTLFASSNVLPYSPPSSSSAPYSQGGYGFIEHPVSKMDTLAGVAIKYGVEVADIKKMNGLVTDLQMFGLKSLQIPLPGRHPPSPFLNGSDISGQSSSEQTPIRRGVSCDLFDSFQSIKLKPSQQQKVSPAMSSLQGYYGLKPPSPPPPPPPPPADEETTSEGFETMVVYRNGVAHYLEDGQYLKPNPPLSRHRKSRSLANGFLDENGELADNNRTNEARSKSNPEKWNKKLVRRCQKTELELSSHTPETLLKEDNSSGGGLLSSITGKGLALRLKSSSRTALAGDGEAGGGGGGLNHAATTVMGGDGIDVGDAHSGVRKSSSTPSLHDQDNGTSSLSALWQTTRWSLKQDLQALSAAAITKPIFDGFPKPMSSRRNKAAMD